EEKRLALVIGNSNYDSIAKLSNPVNDAKLIAKTLESLNFDVILATNLDEDSFMQKIMEFDDIRDNYDVGFVYYAGHGIQIDGNNYLIPTNQNFDVEWKVKKYAIDVNDIMEFLTGSSDEVNILILDACRNNPWEGSFRSIGSSNNGGLAKITVPGGSLIAFSTEPGSVADDGEGLNSVYCTSLVENMKLTNTTLDQVFRNVRADVREASGGRQRPLEESQLTGQAFYLNPTDIAPLYEIVKTWDPDVNYNDLLINIEKILIISPNNYSARLIKARLLYFLENNEKSLNEFNDIESYFLNDILYYKYRASLYSVGLNDNEKALLDYNKLIELEP
ncbi:MAG: caspase family protein, partial [Vicingaceae bacterium]